MNLIYKENYTSIMCALKKTLEISGCTIYDVGERKSRFSTEEKRDGNSLASFSFYNRKQVNFLVEYKSTKTTF